MQWVLLISSSFLVLFTGLKTLEQKIEKRFWFSTFLSKQDSKLERFVGFILNKLTVLKNKIKFLVYVRIPFLAGFVLRKSIVKIIDRTQDVKDNVRGKIKIKSERINASPFLKEIAKIKSRKHRNQNISE